jgi:ABC-type phosphate/phosphonate transport system substrate-binding protein
VKSKLFILSILCLTGIFLVIVNNGCKEKGKTYEPVYSMDSSTKRVIIYIVPTPTFYASTDLFVHYLNQHLKGVQIQTVAGSSFLDWVDMYDKGKFGFTFSNGFKALNAIRNGYSIIASVVEQYGYAGVIIVNRDSSINNLKDLKGKTIATVGTPALAGHMLQMLYLAKNGFDLKKDIRLRKLESFESVTMNVFLGKCAGGFIHKTAWNALIRERPEFLSRVSLLLTTPEIVSNPIVLRTDLDKQIGTQLRQVLFSMQANEEGRKALGKMGYVRIVPADSNSYQPMKQFLKEYDALVGNQ